MSIQSPQVKLETGKPELRQVYTLNAKDLTLPEPEIEEEEEDGLSDSSRRNHD